jgi:hypothetical protein
MTTIRRFDAAYKGTPHQLPNDVPAKMVACLLRMKFMILLFREILPYHRAHLSPH